MTEPEQTPAAVPAPAPAAVASGVPGRWVAVGGAVLAALAAAALVLAWNSQQRLKSLEAELVKRQQGSDAQATEARTLARQAELGAREATAKLALLEARVAETALQRTQIEELIQSLARSRDENVLADIEAAIKPDDAHFARTRLLALENTLGGSLLPFDYVQAATQLAATRGLSRHLDGARLFNAAVASGTPASEIAQHFDSVSVCFSKGLGAPVGSALVVGLLWMFFDEKRRALHDVAAGTVVVKLPRD